MDRPVPVPNLTGLTLLVLAGSCGEIPVQPPSIPSAVPYASTISKIDLGTLGGERSYATDINDAGIVVGWSESVSGVDRAFRWTVERGMTDLGTLPGDEWSRAISITNSGEVFGVSGRTGDNNGKPLVWARSGAATPVPIPALSDATSMLFADRNARGQVIGSALFGHSFVSRAWVWSMFRGLYDIAMDIPEGRAESYAGQINESGLVVGSNNSKVCSDPGVAECWHAFVWDPVAGYRELGLPSGYSPSSAQNTGTALNDRGVVVGWIDDHGRHTPVFHPIEPYRWTRRTGFTVLPTFSAVEVYGYATSVNLGGTVVGAAWDAQVGAMQAAAWPRAGGIVRLSPDDPNPSVAVAVNRSGVVVGWSSHATVWRLGPGRGRNGTTLADQAPSPAFSPATARREASRAGPVRCLSDTRAIISKRLLMECVAKAGGGR